MLRVNISDVETIVRDVADTVILPHFRDLRAHEIHFKGEDNPVTDVDIAAEKVLTERLTALLPGSRVVGEEAHAADPSVLKRFEDDDPIWVIDPIDGTKAYIAGEPLFGVIIALVRQNETVAAWLYDPSSYEFITAEKGAGAWHKGVRLSVREPQPLSEMTGTLGTHIIEQMSQAGEKASVEGPKLSCMLPACHDYARLVVPESHFSGTQESIHFRGIYCVCTPWDNAAGIMINDEAGGYTAHWTGAAFKPSHYGRGLLTAPDKASWMEIRDWVASYCSVASCEGEAA